MPSVFDARPLRPTARHPQLMWVSIAREADVEIHLLRCGLPAERVASVIGGAAALATAFSVLPKRPATAVLLEFAATTGLLVVVEEGQPVFAADLDWGSDHLAAALAADLGRPAAELLDAARWAGGAGFEHALLCELLAHALGGEQLRAWPEIIAEDGTVLTLSGGAVAYGVAVVALGLVEPPPNLAPPPTCAARRDELVVGALHAAGLAVALVTLVLSAFALHARFGALRLRTAEVECLRAARDAAPAVREARRQCESAYLAALPSLHLQKRTRDLITGVRMLRE